MYFSMSDKAANYKELLAAVKLNKSATRRSAPAHSEVEKLLDERR